MKIRRRYFILLINFIQIFDTVMVSHYVRPSTVIAIFIFKLNPSRYHTHCACSYAQVHSKTLKMHHYEQELIGSPAIPVEPAVSVASVVLVAVAVVAVFVVAVKAVCSAVAVVVELPEGAH